MSLKNDALIGTTLGSYEILEAIGQGGMARIYKGFHAELNRYAAIKVVNWGLQEDPEFTERFRREAQAIASLRHSNIVQIFDFGKYANGYFMVMEFIDGSDLADQLRQQRAEEKLLPRNKVIRIIKDIAAALDYAHSRDVIHRDVKPSNIMINKEGQSILTDFGLVMLPSQMSQATLGNTFGTPHYIAPEQAISSAAAVPASDIYSLGVILYEMVTGQLPFDDESPLSVALKHVSNLPTAPSVLNPNLPRDVEDVIIKTLSKQPDDRYALAGDMASALETAWSETAPVASGSKKSVTPVLPAGVPPATEVPNITLPSASAAAPVPTPGPGEDRNPAKRQLPRWVWAALGAAGALLAIIVFSFYIAFSGSPAPTPTAVQVASSGGEARAAEFVPPTDTPTPLLPSDTPTSSPPSTASPTPTPRPSPTPVPPTATSTPTPTATNTPAPTPTATNTPTPTPTDTATPRPLPTATPSGPLSLVQLSGKILFKTDRLGRVEIYRMDANGTNQRPLPPENWPIYTELEDQLPFSPDGNNQIVVRGEGQLDLWWANLVTGQELRVTSTGKPEYDPAWSPIDNRIAYVSEETGRGDIYMLNLDGSANVRLTENVEDFDKHPTWSPDGTKIAFWSDRGFNKNRQIWVIDLNTRVISSLSDNPFNDWDPVWVW